MAALGIMRVVLLCGLVLAVSASAEAQAGDTSFDFFLLVRQWPGTFCSNHACSALLHRDWYRFTLHGLWPNRLDGTWPQFCDSSLPFDEDEVEDLETEMNEAWPSFMENQGGNPNFWAHEWNKHGTCSLTQMKSEHGFFKRTLELHYRYSIQGAFSAAGIMPSGKSAYSKTELEGAIRDMYGVNALIHCGPDSRLTEIWMCFDKSLQPIDCQANKADIGKCKTVEINPLPGAHNGTVEDEVTSWGKAPAEDDAHAVEGQEEGTNFAASATASKADLSHLSSLVVAASMGVVGCVLLVTMVAVLAQRRGDSRLLATQDHERHPLLFKARAPPMGGQTSADPEAAMAELALKQ
eukprot:CAMPEP_0119107044 /NCGR_PEP_ID=MMETSP1180-20130426/7917_1 /TAXON_ID=3052 ORGANISM="Chlamydomonas cf sp, Strain CCMP681" /NCGR_SAMPLE_ID=MMETSP1180 /ASSEMBLY_ACC=CAM_ASM_000741 /LENGTH=350 /DNA_ID=CAMNT_0007092473 /DNA_START=40 /DNA_END=1092 /DNA_ORIENTATION=+